MSDRRERARRATLAACCFAVSALAAFSLAASAGESHGHATAAPRLARAIPPDALSTFRLAATTTLPGFWITPTPTDPSPRLVVASHSVEPEVEDEPAPVSSVSGRTTTTSSTSTTTTTVSSFDVGGAERSFANRINTLREAEGLSPLAWDGSLASAGRSWSQQMVDGVACSHNGSLASQVGGGWTKLAENLACNAPSVGSAHSALVGSSSHYANMVDPDFTHIGVGVAVDAEGDIWATQVFVAR